MDVKAMVGVVALGCPRATLGFLLKEWRRWAKRKAERKRERKQERTGEAEGRKAGKEWEGRRREGRRGEENKRTFACALEEGCKQLKTLPVARIVPFALLSISLGLFLLQLQLCKRCKIHRTTTRRQGLFFGVRVVTRRCCQSEPSVFSTRSDTAARTSQGESVFAEC